MHSNVLIRCINADILEEIEREIRSKFSEAAAESHVADVEAFEQQLLFQKEESDSKVCTHPTVCTFVDCDYIQTVYFSWPRKRMKF